MAGDWIPIRKGFADISEVVQIEEETGASMAEIMWCLFRLWDWFDSESEDGIIVGVSSAICPRRFGQTSEFWSAVQRTGWLVDTEVGGRKALQIPNFGNWMGNSTKRRLLDTKRKALSRASANGPQPVRKFADKKRTTGQDRTEEKKNPLPPMVPECVFQAFVEACGYRPQAIPAKRLFEVNEGLVLLLKLEAGREPEALAAEIRRFGEWHTGVEWKDHPPSPANIPEKWQRFKDYKPKRETPAWVVG